MSRRRKNRKKKYSLNFILTCTAIVLGVGITLAANGFASIGFKQYRIQSRLQALMQENKDLELQITNLQSLHRLKDESVVKDYLVPVGYLKHVIFSKSADSNSVGQK